MTKCACCGQTQPSIGSQSIAATRRQHPFDASDQATVEIASTVQSACRRALELAIEFNADAIEVAHLVMAIAEAADATSVLSHYNLNPVELQRIAAEQASAWAHPQNNRREFQAEAGATTPVWSADLDQLLARAEHAATTRQTFVVTFTELLTVLIDQSGDLPGAAFLHAPADNWASDADRPLETSRTSRTHSWADTEAALEHARNLTEPLSDTQAHHAEHRVSQDPFQLRTNLDESRPAYDPLPSSASARADRTKSGNRRNNTAQSAPHRHPYQLRFNLERHTTATQSANTAGTSGDQASSAKSRAFGLQSHSGHVTCATAVEVDALVRRLAAIEQTLSELTRQFQTLRRADATTRRTETRTHQASATATAAQQSRSSRHQSDASQQSTQQAQSRTSADYDGDEAHGQHRSASSSSRSSGSSRSKSDRSSAHRSATGRFRRSRAWRRNQSSGDRSSRSGQSDGSGHGSGNGSGYGAGSASGDGAGAGQGRARTGRAGSRRGTSSALMRARRRNRRRTTASAYSTGDSGHHTEHLHRASRSAKREWPDREPRDREPRSREPRTHERDVQPAGDQSAREGDPHAKRFYLAMDDEIVAAPSIGPRTADRLTPHGINLVRDLMAADPVDLAERINTRHITVNRIEDWQMQARLVATIPWLRGTHAQLLVGAGYTTAGDISAASIDDLSADILKFAAGREGQRILRAGDPPDIEKIVKWAEYAGMAELNRAA